MPFTRPSSSVRKQRRRRELEFLLRELIGERVRVADSGCRELLGLEGEIVDESLSTFVVRTTRGVKRIPKKGTQFFFPSRDIAVNGSLLYCRPEDRAKKLLKKLLKNC